MAQEKPQTLAEKLEKYTWKNRIVLIFAPSADNQNLLRQKQLLQDAEDGLQDRDLVVMDLIFSQLSPNEQAYARQRFNVTDNAFQTVLIGKDGGVKLQSAEPLPNKRLFQTIDAMPMRRQEVRSNNK